MKWYYSWLFMGKVFLHIMVLCLALFAGGCFGLSNLFSGESKKNTVDAAAMDGIISGR